MTTLAIWRQERPTWCPHNSCIFRRRAMDSICGGELAEPEMHGGDQNTHRLCLRSDVETVDFHVNASDLGWLRWIMDALDGQATSWLSRQGEQKK
jgi:hypothetical protein